MATQPMERIHQSTPIQTHTLSQTYLILGKSPRGELLPGTSVDLAVAGGRLDLVNHNGRDAGNLEGPHVLGVLLDIARDHDLEAVLTLVLAQRVVQDQQTAEVGAVREQRRPDLGRVVPFGV